jgi:aminopeptidase N
MLRNELGDDLFWEGMRTYYKDFRNKNALTTDFQNVMEKVSNTDLSNFFKQWLFTAGQPELKITTSRGVKEGFADITIEQTQEYLFRFDIELQVKDSNGSQMIKIPVSEKTTKRTIRSEKVIEIIPDPNINLLFRIYEDSTRYTGGAKAPETE